MFYVFGKNKMGKMVSSTCRSHKGKRSKCAKRMRKRRVPYAYRPLTFGAIVDQKSITNWFKNSSKKNDHQKTLNWMPKGFQNGPNIDIKSHQKSMPKLVTKRMRKITQILLLWIVKSLKFIVKTNSFEGLEGCMCERERFQKNIKNDIQINEKSIHNSC